MGIKYLNRFLLDNCTKGCIYKTSFASISNKTIVIDASIYLYRFIGIEALCENVFYMVSIMKKYNIVPIFIFDGKPPIEKKELLIQRREKKKEAEKKHGELKSQLESNPKINREELMDIQDQMDELKKQFVIVKDSDIKTMKLLLDSYGVQYIDAPGEADELCVKYVINNIAWACMSDDMDMLVHGCPRVLRQISLLNHTCMFYDLAAILKSLDMTMDMFRQIMVVSGTDYSQDKTTSIMQTMQWYNEFKKMIKQQPDVVDMTRETPFYDWLLKYTESIKTPESLYHIYSKFVLKAEDNPSYHANAMLSVNLEKLIELLREEGFLLA